MTSSAKKLLGVSVLVCIASLAAYALTLFLITEKSRTAEALATASLERRGQEERNRLLSKQLEETAEERAAVDSHFVVSDDVVRFLEAVEAVGSYSGATVEVSGVTDVEETEQKVLEGTLEVRVLLSGSWTEVMHALSLIELLPFHLHIDRVSLATVSDETELPRAWEGSIAVHLTKRAP